ncbi:MAG TPA: prevent-host-death protein [Lactobacillus sp.]|nr:prevent-host-death protein [Lactobacillus sp.]
MIIKSSTALRNNYNEFSDLAKKTGEPIFITKNGEGDTVIMSLDEYERREQALKLRTKLLHAEQQKINGETMSLDEAMEQVMDGLQDE